MTFVKSGGPGGSFDEHTMYAFADEGVAAIATFPALRQTELEQEKNCGIRRSP